MVIIVGFMFVIEELILVNGLINYVFEEILEESVELMLLSDGIIYIVEEIVVMNGEVM